VACIVPPNFDLGGCLDYPLGNNRQERRQFEDYHFLGTRRGYSLDHPPPGNSHLDCPPERSKLDSLDGKDQDRGHGFENHQFRVDYMVNGQVYQCEQSKVF